MTAKERFQAVEEMQRANPTLTVGLELQDDAHVEQLYKRWIANGKPKNAMATDLQHNQTAS